MSKDKETKQLHRYSPCLLHDDVIEAELDDEYELMNQYKEDYNYDDLNEDCY